jgi:hypothetical protein
MGNLISKKEGNIGNDVFDLGAVTGGPWGVGDNNYFGGARWIWNTPGARGGATGSKDNQIIIRFSKSFKNNAAVLGWYNIAVDDVGYIDCNSYPRVNNNGTFYNTTYCSGGWWTQTNTGAFSGINKNLYLLNGMNRVNIYAMNTGGPAGVLANIMSPAGSVQTTGASWKSKIMNTFQNVVELGDVYSSAKNGALYAQVFKSAKFIWSDKNGDSDTNTSPNTYVKFSYVFDYACANGISEYGTCSIATNDECFIYMNCEYFNQESSTPPINVNGYMKDIQILFVQGLNFIDIFVKNTKTTASLIGTFFRPKIMTDVEKNQFTELKMKYDKMMNDYKLSGSTTTPPVRPSIPPGDVAFITNNQWTYSIIPIQSSVGNIYERPVPFESKLKSTIMPQCYPDIATKWIWSTKEHAEGKSGMNIPITFTYSFEYKGNSTRGYCHVIVDDSCILYINDELGVEVQYGGMIWINRDQNTYNEFDLNQGTNTIKFIAKNWGGPAGLAAIFYDNDDNIIAYTNKSWSYSYTRQPNTSDSTTSITDTSQKMNNIEAFTSFKQLKMFEDFSLFNPYKEGFVNLKTWNFPQSNDWYKVVQSGYSIKMADTGITLPTRQYSISFMYNLTGLNGTWNNIFHITNTGRNWGSETDGGATCDGCRQPAVWVIPNDTRLHIRMSTDANFNDGVDLDVVPLNTVSMITFVFDNNDFIMYIDGVEKHTQTFLNIHEIKPSAILHIGDPWHGNNSTINIKGFTIYDGVLTKGQVNNIFDNTDKGKPGKDAKDAKDGAKGDKGDKGDQGIKGEPGENGLPGTPGTNGVNGQKGDPGRSGVDGTPGSKGEKGDPGKDGAVGQNGIDGQKGDPGIPGAQGPKGDRGVPGSTNSKSSLNPGAVIEKKIHRILTNNDTYAYCLGGTITCDDSHLVPITDNYKYGSTYSYRCSNRQAQAYCLNGILESSDRAYLSPFPFSNSYRGFSVETKEQSPYIYDLGTNNIAYYSNDQFVASDDICNLLTDESYLLNCNKPAR